MDVYLTISQVEELHRLVCDGKTAIGVQITGDALARSTVSVVATRYRSDVLDNEFTVIESDGASPGWER